MTCYELLIDNFIKKVGSKYFYENEKKYVVKASIMSGKLIPAGSSFFNAKYRLDLFYLHTKLQKE